MHIQHWPCMALTYTLPDLCIRKGVDLLYTTVSIKSKGKMCFV